MSIKNIFNKLRTVRKRYIVAIATGLIIAVPIAAHAGFGPNRPVIDWNTNKVGSIDGPVFNSYINTPSYGDERAFVDARDSNVPKAFSDNVDVQADKEYTVRAYVHNDANQDYNDAAHGYKSVAKNATVRFKVLSGMGNANEVTGYVSADNIAAGYPQTVYDTVKLKNDAQLFSLEYIAGSARIENNTHPYPGIALPDSIVTTGAKIGYEQLDGNVPGCFQFTNIVTIKVRVKAPKLQISKTVSTLEAPKLADAKKSVAVDRGQAITWRLDYKNNGSDVANKVTIRDTIPKGVTLVPGSIVLLDVNHQTGQSLPDTALDSGGANAGSYASNGNGVIRFRTTVNNDVKDCVLTNSAYVRGEGIPESSDTANITINGCNPTKPIYSCDLLSKELIADHTYRFSVNATALGGAKVKSYTFDYGDGSQKLVTDKTVVEHKYTADGNYVASVVVSVTVDGNTQTAQSPACSQPISFSPTKPATPPTELPNTGAGDILGIFSATTLAGALIHKYWARRLAR